MYFPEPKAFLVDTSREGFHVQILSRPLTPGCPLGLPMGAHGCDACQKLSE